VASISALFRSGLHRRPGMGRGCAVRETVSFNRASGFFVYIQNINTYTVATYIHAARRRLPLMAAALPFRTGSSVVYRPLLGLQPAVWLDGLPLHACELLVE
jgi:hypothetical protein